MNSLIIGNTSQLSYYFPKEYVRVSSRNLDIDKLKDQNWDRVFICLGESRKFIKDLKVYDEVNFYLTLKIIDELKEISRKVIVYSTCELWNQYDGQISLSDNFNFYTTPYLQSKYKISKYIIDNKDFIQNTLDIKNELTNNFSSLISGKKSRYNSDIFVYKCERTRLSVLGN